MDVKYDGLRTVAQDMHRWRYSIRAFVKNMWGLEPQPVKPEFKAAFEAVCATNGKDWERAKKTVKASWFGTYDPVEKCWNWYTPEGYVSDREGFIARRYYTWQQNLILIGIEKAKNGDAMRKISIRSGHGIGKSSTCSWLVLWFLLCFFDSQTAVTAPTSGQMHDVLWKELSKWITRLPPEVKKLYQWQSDYVRMQYSPETWFARARTSSKENTEAIAGVHAESVLIVADEASGVPNEVFDTAEGALTSGNVFVVLISNPTQPMGYFYDTHHKDASVWQLFAFDSEESPIVDKGFVSDKERRFGRDSDEFGIRVKGKFPREGSMDDSGYLQLIPRDKINVRLYDPEMEIPFLGRCILAIDPAGEGKDTCTFVLRDRFKMMLLAEMQSTNDKEIAERAITFMHRYKIAPEDVIVGAFGTGADVAKEIALTGAESKNRVEIYSVMEGNTPDKEQEYNSNFFERRPDELTNPESEPDTYVDLYANLRALMYFRLKNWIVRGGTWVDSESVDNSAFAEQMLTIRYKRTLLGNRIQLMSKKEMKKLGFDSPNVTDAAALSLLRTLDEPVQSDEEKARIAAEEAMEADDRFNAL